MPRPFRLRRPALLAATTLPVAMKLLAAMTLIATAALAQTPTIRVHLTDQETREPLAGVLVSALDPTGAVGPSVLSSSDGTASVRITGAAPHRLLIRRIGFAPVTTGAIPEPSDAGQTLEVVVPVRRITLSTVHVVTNATCSDHTASPSADAEQAWNEVRTALEASALTRSQRLVTTSGITFQRELRTDGTVDVADTTLRGRSGERPFVAPAPAVLERDGYYKLHDDRSEDFYAPDEAVLLSDGFTRRHCVTLSSYVHHDSTGTQVALAFRPRDRDTRPEIQGLIWLDSATSELRHVDFEYVRIALPAPADSIGGSVIFKHLASGAWIVSAWTVRMPRFGAMGRHTNTAMLTGYVEDGGTAAAILDLATPAPDVPRTIVGTVYDSLAHRPLVGAHVRLADLGREVIADSLGGFRFDSVGLGQHTLWADHPRLDSLGLFSLAARVEATPLAVTNVTLAIPAFATLWRRACGATPPPPDDSGIVFGRVVLPGTVPVGASAATIAIAWRPAGSASDSVGRASPAQRAVQADSTGNYVVCGAPVRQALMLSATRGDTTTSPATLLVGSARIARKDLTLTPPTLPSVAGSNAARTLRVVSADSQPVVYANVSVNGGTTLITNEKGEVGLGGGTLNGVTLSVRRIGFAPWFGKLDVPDGPPVFTITLARVGQALGAVQIITRKNPSSPYVQGFYDRWMMRQQGALSAVFIGPEELEFRHPERITTVLRGLNGVQIKCDIKQNCTPFSTLPGSLNATALCPMAVLLDGIQQYGYTTLDDLVDANEVMGIEVYARAGNMPITLQANDSKCGVIALWTGSRR